MYLMPPDQTMTKAGGTNCLSALHILSYFNTSNDNISPKNKISETRAKVHEILGHQM